MKSEKCMFCGARATLYCDGLIAFLGKEEWTGKEFKKFPDIKTSFTCDAPICRDCGHLEMMLHIRRVGFDSVDLCPVCRDHKQNRLAAYSVKWNLCDSVEEGNAMRRAHHAAIRRLMMQQGGTIDGGGQGCLDLRD